MKTRSTDVTSRSEEDSASREDGAEFLAHVHRRERAIVTDMSGRIVAATDEFARLVERCDLVGVSPPFPWWPPEDRDHLSALFRRVIDRSSGDLEGPPFRVEIVQASGRRVPVDVAFHLIRDEYICFLHDPVEGAPSRSEKERVAEALSALTTALQDLGIPPPRSQETSRRMPLQRSGLTRRESQILGMLLAGKRHGEVAELLGLSGHTVKHHIQSVFRKTGVRSHVELLATALLESTSPGDGGRNDDPQRDTR